MGKPATTVQLTEAELRARAREKVAGAARNAGESPRARYSDEDLAWAFKGREHEIDELEQAAEQVREDRKRRTALVADSRRLSRETDRVLAEWAAQRRRDAEAEARRRLGLQEDDR